MNILFCGDANMQKGIYLSSLSISHNNSGPLNVYVLTSDAEGYNAIPSGFAEQLETALFRHNKESSVRVINISGIFGDYLPKANMNTRFTPLCMLRLFADKITEIPNKILYLDGDVLCRKDISQLYDMDISQTEIAGVPDRYGKWFFGNILKHNYLNSGVLLMNMENIRKSGLFEKCRKMCRDEKMFMPDQTALNKLALKIKIPSKYNAQGKIKKDTVFKHFTTYFKFLPYFRAVTIKPWDVCKMHTKLKIYEFDYLLDSLPNFE